MTAPSFAATCGKFALLLSLVLLAGCSPRQYVVGKLADELSGQEMGAESDVELVREASAYHLKLSETLLRQKPDHLKLAESVASGFTQYAYAFVAFDADRIEGRDVKAAEVMRQRAARLYERGHRHAMLALEKASPGFARRLASPNAADWPVLRKEWVGLAYWAAASWGGWISLSKDDPDVVADLPLAIRLANLAWRTDPAWGQGTLTGLMAIFEGARPGGSMKQAEIYYDQAIAQSAGRSVGALLGKAEGVALAAGDREAFERLLNEALAIKDVPGSPLLLQNEVMRRRARWLQGRIDELF